MQCSTADTVWTVAVGIRRLGQISCRSLNQLLVIEIFRFCKMAASTVLGSQKFEIITAWFLRLTVCINGSFFTFIFAVVLPVLSRLSITFILILHFRFFKMAAVCHLGFFKVRNFNCWSGSGLICVIMPNVVPIGQTVAEISRFFLIFQDGCRRHRGFF